MQERRSTFLMVSVAGVNSIDWRAPPSPPRFADGLAFTEATSNAGTTCAPAAVTKATKAAAASILERMKRPPQEKRRTMPICDKDALRFPAEIPALPLTRLLSSCWVTRLGLPRPRRFKPCGTVGWISPPPQIYAILAIYSSEYRVYYRREWNLLTDYCSSSQAAGSSSASRAIIFVCMASWR